MKEKEIFLKDAKFLEKAPVVFRPVSREEKLAALSAYLTGDGSVCVKHSKYKRKDGSFSVYTHRACAFYSSKKEDLELILEDIKSLGVETNATVRRKKQKKGSGLEDGYQIQFSETVAGLFIDLGVPCGKKTDMEFDVPSFVKNGTDRVKIAYISALWGAEGSTPCFEKNKVPKTFSLSMCKIKPKSGSDFFASLAEIVSSLGVKCSVERCESEAFGKTYVTNTLYISPGVDNVTLFLTKIGSTYCREKSDECFLVANYLKALNADASKRSEVLDRVMSGDISSREAAGILGTSLASVVALKYRAKSVSSIRASNSFPHYDEWKAERWMPHLRLLRLAVVSSSIRDKKESVYNLTVTSSDRSYLLASGLNNFNSFETVTGSVYYNFNREAHIKPCAFNPALPIWVGQDFNVSPMSSVIMQPQPNGELWVVDEIYQFNSNTLSICNELERRYWKYMRQVTIYPDPAGGSRSTARGETDLDIFRERGFRRIKYRKQHPLVADRVNCVNKLLMNAEGKVTLRIDPKCKNLIESFEQTAYKEGTNEIDKRPSVEHITDAIGYPIEIEYPRHKIELIGVSI